MHQRLPRKCTRPPRTIDQGEPARSGRRRRRRGHLKDWAIENGASHYTTGSAAHRLTAEKHDSLRRAGREQGGVVFNFSGADLVQGEPDASSFPSGASARPSRPAAIRRGTRPVPPSSCGATTTSPSCIPTAFVSGPAEALDTRSRCSARSRRVAPGDARAQDLRHRLGVRRVYTTSARNRNTSSSDRDSTTSGRPGHLRALAVRRQAAQGPAARGSLLRHHPAAGVAFMSESERELYRLGVRSRPGTTRWRPASTRSPRCSSEPHRERSPDADHGDLEAGGPATGSRRCCTRSRSPASTLRQAQQLVDEHRHGRQPARSSGRHPHQHAVPGVPGGDHPGSGRARRPAAGVDRLGGQRPPAGRQRSAAGHHLHLSWGRCWATSWSRWRRGCPSGPSAAAPSISAPRRCPSCRVTRATATGPRRSRSPATSSNSARWARAPASRGPTRAQHHRAESLDHVATQLEKAVGAKPSPARLQQGVLSVLKRLIKEHKRVIFDGDNYSEEWHAEADRRGLPT